jgi:glutamate 5-kinase
MADHLQVRGRLKLDDGAVRALKSEGKSLLPIGVIAATGEFERGEVVSCLIRRTMKSRADSSTTVPPRRARSSGRQARKSRRGWDTSMSPN